MKLIATTILAVMIASQALAGPFRSVGIVGTGIDPDFTLEVPAGRAVTITSFNDSGPDAQYAAIAVTIKDKTVNVIRGAPYDGKNTQKDVTIAGPATIKVSVATDNTVFLTYKVFAN
jgi:hypothetical protein